MRRLTIILLTIIVLIALTFVLCTYRVRPYESVIVDRFGKALGNEQQTRIIYGWYFCLPTDKIVRLDQRLHLHQGGLVQSATGSGEPLSVRAFAAWRISKPTLFYASFQGNDARADKMISDKVSAIVQGVLSGYPLNALFNAQKGSATSLPVEGQHMISTTASEQIEAEVTRRVNMDMAGTGIEITQVGFSRMAFPPGVALSVYERMRAERDRLAMGFKAEGDATAEQLRSEAKAQADKIRSEAERTAQNIRGEGDAKALEALAAVQDTPEKKAFYQFWRELELLKSSVGKGTYLILRSDQPIVQQLMNQKSAPQHP